MPTLKLARIMYAENNLLFKNLEAARDSLRRIEGKASTRVKKTHPHPERPKNPYNLPESDEKEWTPYPIIGNKILVLSDIHVPYHNIKALTAAIDYGKSIKPDVILLNGDTIDFYGLSKWEKDPKKRRIKEELDTFGEVIAILKKSVCENIVLKIGNHEERLIKFLFQKAHEISDLEEFQLEQILKKRCGDIEIIGDKRIIKAGKLNILHGHEFQQGITAPVNIARGLYLRAKVSTMQGHNHQTSEHTEPNLDGEIITTWSTGCLCELHPAYAPINKWNHGIASVEVFKDNTFNVENKRIRNGKIL